MQIDFRDVDFIWSSATVVDIHRPTIVAETLSDDPLNIKQQPTYTSLFVTVRYDGTSFMIILLLTYFDEKLVC